jgi:hypothetical protein
MALGWWGLPWMGAMALVFSVVAPPSWSWTFGKDFTLRSLRASAGALCSGWFADLGPVFAAFREYRKDPAYERDAQRLIDDRVGELKRLPYADVARLAAATSVQVLVGGRKSSLATYVQRLPSHDLLAAVQIVHLSALGIGDRHIERGLVFSMDGAVREATPEELEKTASASQ